MVLSHEENPDIEKPPQLVYKIDVNIFPSGTSYYSLSFPANLHWVTTDGCHSTKQCWEATVTLPAVQTIPVTEANSNKWHVVGYTKQKEATEARLFFVADLGKKLYAPSYPTPHIAILETKKNAKGQRKFVFAAPSADKDPDEDKMKWTYYKEKGHMMVVVHRDVEGFKEDFRLLTGQNGKTRDQVTGDPKSFEVFDVDAEGYAGTRGYVRLVEIAKKREEHMKVLESAKDSDSP